jgi:phage terminase large subunit
MDTYRIKEIQEETAYPKSVSVQQALLKVWNETAQEQLRIAAVIKSLPSAIILAEKFAESKREHVVKCRIEKGSIANLGLYLGFIEGYNYVIEELKRGNVL